MSGLGERIRRAMFPPIAVGTPERSDVQIALDELDDAMGDLDALSDDDLDAVDAWANNVQLDIMRHRRRIR